MEYQVGDEVMYKVGRGWGKGTVKTLADTGGIGTYEVATADGHVIKRNAQHLRKPVEGGAA